MFTAHRAQTETNLALMNQTPMNPFAEHVRQLPEVSAQSTLPEHRQPCTASVLLRLKCVPALKPRIHERAE